MNEASIFGAALEKTVPKERLAYVAEACAGDEKLRRRVEALLRVHAEPDDLLDLLEPMARTVGNAPLTEGPGTVIGPYKLLQQIGEGGFGVVYMAEQTQPVRRIVALKIIKPGMDTAQVIARFESERQALALMDHPNIAKVLEAGATESGRPFFVMELVKGVPITDFCDKNHLSPEARLKLFIDVCLAVQHAHQKGVIHRDIKPSNVMVTLHDGEPVVKVIDFGVAKATGQKLTERTLFTAFGQMIGTPAYMSPEQAEMSGLDIDTRSDVYALGVLLYELLTGTTPLEAQRLRQAGYAEMQRLIREEEAPRPSTRLSSLGGSATVLAGARGLDAKRLVQLLTGDLDWLVMKALDKDRKRRYSTPGSFAEDIERYLRREVLMARPPSAAYRLSKFVQRNRAAVLTTAVVAASLFLGMILTTWQAIRATRAEGQATDALAQAKTEGERALAAEHLASDRLTQVGHEKQQVTEALEKAEADRAWAQEAGDLAAARLTQLMHEMERAEKAQTEATSERGKADDRLKWAVAMEFLYDAVQAEQQGSYEAAEHLFRAGLEYTQTELGPDRIQTFYFTFGLSDFYSRRNTPEKAEELLRKLRDFHKLRQERNPEAFDEGYVRTLDALGLNLLRQHKWADAQAVLREDLTIREKLNSEIISANARSMLGASLVGQEEYAEAEPLLRKGYEGLKELTNAAVFGNVCRDLTMPLLKQAVERLVELYEAWDKPDETAKWSKELEEFKK